MIHGFLLALCSRNPKTFEIRPIRATFSCFAHPKGHACIIIIKKYNEFCGKKQMN